MNWIRAGCVLLLAGCDVSLPKIAVPPLPIVDGLTLPLPKLANGNYQLMNLSQAQLELDPTVRDPLTSMGDCVDLVSYCYAPNERSLDECVRSVATCKTETPWASELIPCCPAQCQEDFVDARKSMDPAAALDDVFFEKHRCFPGVSAALEGK